MIEEQSGKPSKSLYNDLERIRTLRGALSVRNNDIARLEEIVRRYVDEYGVLPALPGGVVGRELVGD